MLTFPHHRNARVPSTASGARGRALLSTIAAAATLAAALVALPSAAHAATVSELEPNGSTATATALPAGSTVTGSAYSGTSYYDEDFYRFTVTAPSRLALSFAYPSGLGTGTAYDFTVLDSSGDERFDDSLDGGDSTGAWASAHAMYLGPGTYYIEIYGSESWATWGKTYSLGVQLTPGSDETEPNGASATADALAPGTKITGSALGASYYDEDFYRFTVAAPSRLKLALAFPSGLGTGSAYDLTVYDASGGERFDYDLDGGDSTGAWASADAMYVGPGTYYIEIYGSESWATWGKSYSLSVGLTPGADETEPNGTSATADPLALGKPVTASALGASYYDQDFYRFTVPSGSHAIALKVGLAAGLGTNDAYSLSLQNSSGDNLGSWQLNGQGVGAPPVLTLAGGQYYFAVEGTESSASWGTPYTVTVSQVLAPTPVPTIAGTAQVGHTLTAHSGTWGPAPVTLAYQWLRGGKAIAGATKSTYKLVAADAGATVSLRITGSKPGFAAVAETSAPTAAVKPQAIAVSRVAGADRFATSVAASAKEFPHGTSTVLIASGLNYPDALAAAPAAAKAHGALLLTAPTSLPASVRAELKRLKPKAVYLIGGTGAIGAGVAAQVKAATGVTPVRVAGADRYATSAAIAAKFFPSSSAGVFVATGLGFPDALSAASAAAGKGAPVLLVPGLAAQATPAVVAQLRLLHPSAIYVVGGTGVVSPALAASLGKATRLAGADRFGTAVAVAAKFYGSSASAVLANGLNFPDALVGSVLAGSAHTPLYLTSASCVPAAIAKDIARIKATSLTLMGGTGVLGAGVAARTTCR
jgi:putative cell wall-binding protein